MAKKNKTVRHRVTLYVLKDCKDRTMSEKQMKRWVEKHFEGSDYGTVEVSGVSNDEVRKVYLLQDVDQGGYVAYNAVEGWHFTTLKFQAKVFQSKEDAHIVAKVHYKDVRLEVVTEYESK